MSTPDRAAFEERYSHEKLVGSVDPHGVWQYDTYRTQTLWDGWCAALSEQAQPEQSGRLGVALALLSECLGPLEVSSATIESEDGGEAIETLIEQVRKFIADAKTLGIAAPPPDLESLETGEGDAR